MLAEFRSDIQRYRRYGAKCSTLRLFLENQGLWAMLCYRVGHHFHFHPLAWGLRHLYKVFYFFWWKGVQVMTGIYILPETKIGPGFFVGHFSGIFVGAVEIGTDCNVAQGVTVGYGFKNGVWGLPTLGDRVWIAAGAKVFGPIVLGSGTVVGANAVVNKDTPENAVVAGVPARVLNFNGSAAYIGDRFGRS